MIWAYLLYSKADQAIIDNRIAQLYSNTIRVSGHCLLYTISRLFAKYGSCLLYTFQTMLYGLHCLPYAKTAFPDHKQLYLCSIFRIRCLGETCPFNKSNQALNNTQRLDMSKTRDHHAMIAKCPGWRRCNVSSHTDKSGIDQSSINRAALSQWYVFVGFALSICFPVIRYYANTPICSNLRLNPF